VSPPPVAPAPTPTPWWPSTAPLPDAAAVARVVAAAAAAVLAVASTGSAAVAALLLGVATGSRRSGAAALLAVLATSVRFRTAALDDLAGIQSVLGGAIEVGPATAAASAWLAALAVLLATAALPDPPVPVLRWAPALPAGLLAAALAAGPGPSELLVRAATSLAGVGLALLAIRTADLARAGSARAWLAVAAGAAAVVLAGWPA